ncbi:MAG TPA: hypothetical protein VF199_05965 [Bacillales bacterium]
MNDQRLFFSFLKVMRRKLWLERAVSLFYIVLPITVGAVVAWVLLGRFIVILHLDVKVWMTSALGLLVWFAVALYKRPSWKEAARHYDSYGLDDRVVTMLGFLDDDSEMIRLQRKDAIRAMKDALSDVKARQLRWFYWKQAVLVFAVGIMVAFGLAYPNDVMEKAAQMEKENQIVTEKKQEVKQFVKEQKDEVKPKAKEELEALKKEVAKARKAGEMMDEMLEAEAKLAELRKQAKASQDKLRRMESGLESAGLHGMASALRQRDRAALAKALQAKLKGLSEAEKKQLMEKLQKLAKAAGAGVGSGKQEEAAGEKSRAALEKKLAEMMKAAGGLQALADAQRKLQEMAKGLNRKMAAAGLAQPGKLAFGGGGGSMPAGSGQPGAGGSGKGGAGGKKSGSGKTGSGSGGEGSGSGAGGASGGKGRGGSGSGSGSGSGTGGTGSGVAPGNGAGFGVGSRELLTVPKNLEGQENREVDTGKLGEGKSTKQVAPQSPILPGQVRQYEQVYGEYQSSYRQSMERMNLPGHLQSVVKNYFSELEPNQE